MTTFTLDELLGTKLRALYQRKKGRDLFDICMALGRNDVNPRRVLDCFHRRMSEGGHTATRAQIEENLAAKRLDPRFTIDLEPLLRPEIDWDLDAAMDAVLAKLIPQIPGAPLAGIPWRGWL